MGAFAKIKVTASTLAPVAGDKVQITAQLQDKNGNDIKAARQINFSTNKGSVAANGTTDAGTGSVTIDLTTDTKSGIGHTVTAVDNANTEIKSDTQLITTVAGIGVKYLLTTANATPKFDTEIIINAQLVDVNNNAVPTATPRTINWASTNGGTFSGATGTDVTGKATVNFKVSNVVNTTHEVTATDNVDGTIKGTLSITTVAGPPSKYIVTTSNATPVAGEDITIKAQLTDEGNNPHKIPNITVNWTFTGTGGELADTKSKTDQNGIAEVKFKTSKTANTAHTVTAKDSVPREGTTNTFTTKAGAYAKLKVTAAPLDPVAGEKTVITVQLQDINGNDVKEAKQISFTTDKGTLENPATKTTDALTGKTTIELTTDTKSGTVHKVTANDGTTNFDAPVITTKSGAYAKLKITASTVTPVAGGQLG
ncbi:MAG: hypothetical protein FD143_1661 [Ignavibacteria bacterium]|nr:MAG: hypothetical protein FD143_1661 [Ignavibacteria bacterium]